MLANANLISSNFLPFGPLLHPRSHNTIKFPTNSSLKPLNRLKSNNLKRLISPLKNKGTFQICQSSISKDKDPVVENEDSGNNEVPNVENGDGGGENWITSILLFFFWVALLYYVFNLSPNQTPLRDTYFLKKLSNLVGDDGFRMNQILVSLWYIMGLWPLVYCMLLLPTGRSCSSKGKIPVWPFVTLSFFGGAYALIPYFILWRPPPPPVEEEELSRWPLNFLESKITAGVRADFVRNIFPLPYDHLLVLKHAYERERERERGKKISMKRPHITEDPAYLYQVAHIELLALDFGHIDKRENGDC